MKKLLIISMALISCGKDDSKDAALPMQTALLVQKTDQLPICNEINDKQVFYVSEEKKLKSCQLGNWVNVELEQNTIVAEKADKGEKGEKGDKGEAGKDGIVKPMKVYSAGKEIGFLIDEKPEEYLLKTSKGYYFRIDPDTGIIPNTSGFSLRNVAYQSNDCSGKQLTAGIRPGEILVNLYYGEKIMRYAPKETKKVLYTDMASTYDERMGCEWQRGGVMLGNGSFAEAKENDPEVTGLETKWEFELPITIGE